MKVRDLVKDTVWRPGRSYDAARPLISVLMPTFRRGHDESFLKAANSVLDQSLRDLELIVVDDGSTDGTAQQIAALMATDARVSCLAHPANIGLPAVSEYEAFMRARGEYIAFGFDDFIFDRDALSRLMAFPLTSPRSVVHGYVGWFDGQGRQNFYGKDAIPHERLKFFNYLANASFLVPRAILQDVGLFDPHVAATRLCDWDLWCRILKKYPIHRAPVFIGTEHGNTRDDSLGNTYPLIEESFQEYFATDRNQLLKPENFLEFDVWKMPQTSSPLLAAHIFWSREFFRSRSWASGRRFSADTDEAIFPWSGRPALGIYGAISTSTALIFNQLPAALQQDLRYVHPDLTDAQLARCLAGCGAVIMADRVDPRSERVRSMCAVIDIPLHCMSDENPAVRIKNGHTHEITLVAGAPARNLEVLTEVMAGGRPVNAVRWIIRLRALLDRGYARVDRLETGLAAAEAELASRSHRVNYLETGLAAAEAELSSRSDRVNYLETGLAAAEAALASRSHRLDRLETDLRDRSIRLAAAEAELASRSFRLALWIRSLANGLRKIARWLHLR
jgi:glycosyltransferase involved in cell wall biosynthesis